MKQFLTLCIAVLLPISTIFSQNVTLNRYIIGDIVVKSVYVNPQTGKDDNDGSREKPFATVTEAWNRIPENRELSEGVRIILQRGTYTNKHFPNYWENRFGTKQYPIIIQSEEGLGSTSIRAGFNIAACSFVYIVGLNLTDPDATADIVHFQTGHHYLLRNCLLQGDYKTTQECLKVNQSVHVYIEDCNISGAWDNSIDMVAVQYGHIKGCKIHDCGDWACYTKGGSAYIVVEGNEFFNAGTGGYTAGQGTGFQFMTLPWLHYEAYDIKVVNNIVHDCDGAAFGVNGGYNILIAHNTAYRIGKRSHVFEAVFGSRSCDGQPGGSFDSCFRYSNYGGWGNSRIADGENYTRIPNRNVLVYNNIFYNPSGYQSEFQQFAIAGKYSGDFQLGSNIKTPTVADEGLVFKGNIIWNGPDGHPLGVGDDNGCGSDNPTCNEEQLRKDNTINLFMPEFVNAVQGDFTPIAKGNIFTSTTFIVPDFIGNDRPEKPATPNGIYANTVAHDYFGNDRMEFVIAGAIAKPKIVSVQDEPQSTSRVIVVDSDRKILTQLLEQYSATSLEMFDINGSRVFISQFASGASNLSDLCSQTLFPWGVYALVVHSNTDVHTYIMVVTR